MSSKEQGRLRMFNLVLRGHMTVGEAAETMQLSVRHTWRILGAYRREGARAVIHGNRGRQPARTIGHADRERVSTLARERYAALNDSHRTEVLGEQEGISLSRSSVRRIRWEAGLVSPRKRRELVHRVRRARRAESGQLVQVDGSQHWWFSPDHPQAVLMAAIDDATNIDVAAHFREREDSLGYLQLLQDMIAKYGCPVALYHDKHRIFMNPEPETIDDQLTGRPSLTQVGRALINSVCTPLQPTHCKPRDASSASYALARTDSVEKLPGNRLRRLPRRTRFCRSSSLGITSTLLAAPLIQSSILTVLAYVD